MGLGESKQTYKCKTQYISCNFWVCVGTINWYCNLLLLLLLEILSHTHGISFCDGFEPDQGTKDVLIVNNAFLFVQCLKLILSGMFDLTLTHMSVSLYPFYLSLARSFSVAVLEYHVFVSTLCLMELQMKQTQNCEIIETNFRSPDDHRNHIIAYTTTAKRNTHTHETLYNGCATLAKTTKKETLNKSCTKKEFLCL